MGSITLTTIARDASTNAIVDRIDAGGGAGYLELGTGNPGAFGTVLCHIVLGATAFGASGAVNPGEAILSGVPLSDVSADATGVATVFRFRDSASITIFSGDITVTGGGGTMTMPSTTITLGEPVRIDQFTFGTPV